MSVAGVTAAVGSAVLCATVLAGCRAHGVVSQQPANGAGVVSTSSDAGVDSDLNAVDGQLSGLDSALAQATQSPSDGG